MMFLFLLSLDSTPFSNSMMPLASSIWVRLMGISDNS